MSDASHSTTPNTAPSTRDPVVLRSMLFIPVIQDRFLAKAHTRGADAIILDLEDSIALSEKPAARKLIAGAAEQLQKRGLEVWVRINSPLRLGIPDLEATVCPAVTGIKIPKARSAEHVRMVSETIAELEAEKGMAVGVTKLGAVIETASAFEQVNEVAHADPRLRTFGLGSEDFSLEIGVEPSIETLIYPKQRAIIAAHAAGLTPLGLVSSGADFTDLDGMRKVAEESRRFGYAGASCIHPAVVPVLNEAFGLTKEEIANAQKVADAFREAEARGSASINVDGKMVDYPVAYRAENVLKRAALIAEREAATRRVQEA